MIIEINTQSPSPIYEQLRDQVVLGIASGRLAADEALPSVRSLAADLGVNFHTVNKSYAMLGDEGYIVMDRRRGAVVAQEMEGGASFLAKLSRGLLLSAAEGICRGMSEDDYVSLCVKAYREAEGNSKKGATKA